SKESINEEFFKKGICSVIMFDELDVMVNKSEWYPKGGDKAQIIPYTIAKLMSLLPKNTDLDWKTIWNKQTMYPALAKELIHLALETQCFLKEQAGGGLVRTISRTHAVWETYKKVPYELSNTFIATLISKEDTIETENAARRVHKFNSNIDVSVEIFNLGADYWMKVYNDLSRENILSYGDLDFIKSISTKYISKMVLPSAAQCKRLLKIVHNAEDKGYIMP
ncbi:MAG: AIPR family protein, partial [Prevotella sp.]|nr:AIPR family protein [Prevotella sp.]